MAWCTITFGQNGGTGGETRTLYGYYYSSSSPWIQYYATSKSTSTSYRITKCTVPTKSGYAFAGYYNGSNRFAKPDGSLLGYIAQVGSTLSLTAKWVTQWVITLNRGSGSGGTATLYYKISGGGFFSDSAMTQRVTAITPPTYGDHPFAGYFSDSALTQKYINADGTFTSAFLSLVPSDDITLYAGWEEILDDFDFFGAAGDNLMIVSSEPGEFRNVVETGGSTGSGTSLKAGCLAIQTANSSVAAFQEGAILKNPTCTYRIKAAGSVSFQLGKAWSSTNGKFFLTEVRYETGADKEPRLILKGVANEGANAINLWTVTFNVSPDHVAQDPYASGAISGGGELVECATIASAEPVVLYEDGEPCASDIVHGKVTVKGRTNAYFGESAPTAQTSHGFIETNGVPKVVTDTDFTSYEIVAERSL